MIPLVLAAALVVPQPRPSPRPPTPEEIESAGSSLLQRASAGEPHLVDVQQAAARHAVVSPAAASAARRARVAALLPKLSVEMQRDDRRYRVVGLTATSEVDYVRDSPGTLFAVRLSWDLAGTVFADAELRLAEKDVATAKARAEAVERATKLYFERRRLLLSLAAAPPGSPRERAEREVEIEELGGALDAMTGGLWSAGGAR